MNKTDLPAGAALVTGAARRIGRAIALGLADAGFAIGVHASDRSRAEAHQLARQIEEQGGRAVVLVADLAEPTAVRGLLAAAGEALGTIGVLVNNASLFEPDAALPFDAESFERHMMTNLRAPLQLAADMAAQARPGRDAAIVNILDQRVLRPNPQFFSYTLSKAALWAATRTMAQAYAPDIRVNGVGPGPTLANHMQRPEDFDREAQNVLLRRAVEPAEIAAAVLYLVSARGVTGQMIAVDGGQHLGWRTPDVEA